MRARVFGSALVSLFFAAALAGAALAPADDVVSRQAKVAILDRSYREAADLLAKDPGEGEQIPTRRFLRAHALLLAGDGAAAAAAFDAFAKDFPGSLDAPRARLSAATARRMTRDFAGAAALDRDQLRALLSPERRLELAKVYLDYAEKAEKGVTPDFTRARTFLDLAASLELPKADDERVRSKAAEMSEKLKDFPNALERMRAVQTAHGDGPGGLTRFRVAQLRRLTGDLRGARRAYRDFLHDFPASEKAAEAGAGIALTYGMPAPADDESLARGIAALRDVIARHPKSPEARRAAFEIAEGELHRARYDEAVRDFRAFAAEAPKDRAEENNVALARARIGDALYAQARYADAIAAWKIYLAEHPSHGEFGRVHRAIVDAEHAIAATAAREALESAAKAKEKGDTARAALRDFLAAHPLDARQAATALLLPRIEEARERYDSAREEYESTASRYAGAPEASEAQFHVGRLYEERTFDYEKALEAYARVQGPWADRAKQRVAELRKKSLAVKTPRTWRTDEEPSVELTSRNVEKLRLRIYKLDLESFFRVKLGAPRIESLDTEVIEADVRREVLLSPYVAHRETTRPLSLPECKGKPGTFVVKADDGELESTVLVLVSDLVLVTKASRRDVLVFAQNARTGAPVPGVRLVAADGTKILFEDVTGADGVKLRRDEGLAKAARLAVYGSGADGAAVSGLDLASLRASAELSPRCVVVLDRGSYRPGESAEAFVIARSVKDGSYAIEEGRKLRIALLDPSGTSLRSSDVALSPFGTARATLSLPPNSPLGAYSIAVIDDASLKTLAAQPFAVEEVRRERIRLDVTLESPVVMRGEPAVGKVTASYFSGGPAAKRALTVVLADDEPATLTTDEAGVATFKLDTRELAEEGSYRIAAQLAEESSFGSAELTVATVEYRPSITTLQAVVLADEPFDAAVATKNVAGKPVGAELRLSVLRREERGLRKVEEKAVTTDRTTGKSTARLSIAKGGDYVLRVEGLDRFGTSVAAEKSITVSDESDETKLRLFTERDVWKLGETASVRVVSRLDAERTALVTHEGGGVLRYRLVPLPRGESKLEVPFDETLAPQFTLALAAVDGWKLRQAAKALTVTKDLAIEVGAPPTSVPGGEVSVDVTVRDARGNPTAADVAIAVVDAALLAQRPDATPLLGPLFFATAREAGTRTASSCAFEYCGLTRAVSGDLAAEEERLRLLRDQDRASKPAEGDVFTLAGKGALDELASDGEVSLEAKEKIAALKKPAADGARSAAAPEARRVFGKDLNDKSELRPTGSARAQSQLSGQDESALRRFFGATAAFAAVTSGADGRGRLTFRLPDSATEWRIAARGVTKSTELGEAFASFAARRDVEASLRLPGAFCEGDRAEAVPLVRNAGTEKRSVTTDLSLDGATLEGSELSGSLDLAPGQETALGGRLVIGSAESVRIALRAKSADRADGIERSVSVRPAASFVAASASRTVRDRAKIDLTLPDFGMLRRPTLTITVAPPLETAVLEDAEAKSRAYFLPDGPEATVTRGEVALERLAFLAAVGGPDADALARQRRRVSDAAARLLTEQRADGSFGWAGNQSASSQVRPDAGTAARTLAFFSRARAAGFAIPDAAIEKSAKWVRERLRAEDPPTDRARLLVALAETGGADADLVNRLQRAKAELPDTALALLALADLRLGRKDLAAEAAGELRKRAPSWGSAPVPGTDVAEATGLAVRALAALDPRDALLAPAVDALRSLRGTRLTPRGEAAVVAALAAYFGAAKPAGAEFELTISLGDERLRTVKSAELRTPVVVEVDPAKIRATNALSFELRGRGEAVVDAVLTALMAGFDPLARRRLASVRRTVDPVRLLYRGKTIPRGFNILDGPYESFSDEVKNLPLGAEAEVLVSFTAHEKEAHLLDYAILEEPIPAGCEVVPESISGSFERVVVRDGALVAAYGAKDRGGWIRYRLLGVRAGDYLHAPAVLRSAYRPERTAESAERRLVVLAPGKPSPDERRLTPEELYHLGVARFDAGEKKEGAELLRRAVREWRLRDEPLREASRRILLEAIERNDAPAAIASFERLRDRFPEVVLPFETAAQVGEAYLADGQAEVADLVFRGTMAALFRREANVAGSLLREGEFLAAVQFLEGLHRLYPDLPEILTALHQLAGLVATAATDGTAKGLARDPLLARAGQLELEFLVRAPEDPLAPEAAFGFLSSELERNRPTGVTEGCAAFSRRYATSALLDKVLFLEGYARFASGDPKGAIAVLDRVTGETFPDGRGGKRPSDQKDRAVLLRAQILHATGDGRGAVAEYEKVKELFTDAADAIRSFRRRALSLPPTLTLTGSQPIELLVSSRNLAKAELRAYRVDLMRLYLMERNLDRMTSIDLAGISPLMTREVALPEAEFLDHETKLPLELPDRGAYLVVLRSAAAPGAEPQAAATLVLRSDLRLEVREDAPAGRVRIEVRDAKGAGVPRADVRVVGSADGLVRSGTTDLRGVFTAEAVRGRATVVAQVVPEGKPEEGPSFAFFRGTTSLGAAPVPQAGSEVAERSKAQRQEEAFYEENTTEFRKTNQLLQLKNRTALEGLLNTSQQGVEMQRVK